ncbi:class I SAM-dependent methyltransferase [Mesorhizobium sp. AR07]|uniref:class I SAM-dependent methyltransferase n=1 Tax=Mesorhizobium sp. AR07 TaxID=2865838 RepID=UPI0021606B15|nr:class I SAM-dependent methyltransferase [Mesorhizobium sp. AR07]UVK45776.1 class I SAM-dependent methyltransferase [Mesorhizobium sp. AR07]
MHQGVGGEYEGIGKIEAALLTHLGLAEGHFVVDVGCGSGRLAAALSRGPKIAYHGTDVVPEFLDYARAHSAEDFRFSLVDGLSIPEADSVADFVTFFSVMTHLMLHETYTYLLEAARVVKPGGLIVVSFLDPSNTWHWETLRRTEAEARAGTLVHLNAFIEPKTMMTLANRLGMELQAIHKRARRSSPSQSQLRCPGAGWFELERLTILPGTFASWVNPSLSFANPRSMSSHPRPDNVGVIEIGSGQSRGAFARPRVLGGKFSRARANGSPSVV